MAGLKKQFDTIARGESKLAFDPRDTLPDRILHVPIEDIRPDPDQPRRDLGDLESLETSIRAEGILQPLILERLENENFCRIVSGERRYAAAKAAGLTSVPAIMRSFEAQRKLRVQIIENLQRKNLNPIEEARAFQRLIDEFGLSQRDLATQVGKSVAGINQMLGILKLPEDILEESLRYPDVTASALVELSKTPADQQQGTWEKVREGQLTVKSLRSMRTPKDHQEKPPSTRWQYKDSMGDVRLFLEFPQGPQSDHSVGEALEAFLSRLNEE